MISKIEIRNFRTHKKQDIEFGKGVTSIIGESFEGKSTIIRALKWVALNCPAGDKMIRWRSDNASVRVTVDGKRVIRRKGKVGNIYKLSSHKKAFEAFGSNVPKPIAALFNLSTINFQGQFEAPFWFCETAGEVSRKLNTIVNLEIIDKTLSNIASEIRKTRTVVDVIKERVDEAEEKRKKLKYIKQMNNDFCFIEKQQKTIEKTAEKWSLLLQLTETAIKYQDELKDAEDSAREGNLVVKKIEAYHKICILRANLQNLVKTVQNHVKIIKNKPPSLSPLKRRMTAWEEAKGEVNTLEEMIYEIEESEGSIRKAKKRKRRLREEMEKLVGKTCPLCKQPLMS